MSTIDALKDIDQNEFYPLQDLLFERHITPQAAASAIELDGVQAFDGCGRFVILKPGSEQERYGVSISGAISTIERAVQEEDERIYNNEPYKDPRSTNEYWRREVERSPSIIYGWRIVDLPNFNNLHASWTKVASGLDVDAVPEKPLATQGKNSAKKLIRALVQLKYGKKMIAHLDQHFPTCITTICKDLELIGCTFDRKTLKTWLKN